MAPGPSNNSPSAPRALNNNPKAIWDHSGKNPKNPPGPDPTQPKSLFFSAHVRHDGWISAPPGARP